MQNFFYDNEFYYELEDLIESIFDDDSEIYELPEDYRIQIIGSKVEPVFKLTPDFIMERISEHRFPEYMDEIWDKIYNILNNKIPYDEINFHIPELYYEDYKNKSYISKQDLIKYINNETN